MAKKKDDHILPFPTGGRDDIRTKDDLLQMVLLAEGKTMADLAPAEKEEMLALASEIFISDHSPSAVVGSEVAVIV